MRLASVSLRRAAALLVVGLAVLAGACGSDGNDSNQASNQGSSSTTNMSGMNGMDNNGSSFAFGAAADASAATRTIEVSMDDSFAYDPSAITVDSGETVLFEVTNSGQIAHEFTLGDDEMQADHEQEMSEMADPTMMDDEPNAIVVPAGQTKQLAFTFTTASELEYACHQPGHYDGGMKGRLTVS